MRATVWLLIIAAAACGPKHVPGQTVEAVATPSEPELRDTAVAVTAEAPPGKGLRQGTIDRSKLAAVLKKGPGAFLSQLEVAPQLQGKRFIGWQLVRLLDRNSPLADVDVAPGDVLVAINGNSVSRPEQLQTLWDSLRKANSLDAVLHRGTTKVQLAFAIEPAVR